MVLEENKCDGDHINGELYDNRKSSLRKTTHQQNMINQKLHKNNTHLFPLILKIIFILSLQEIPPQP